MVAKSSAQSDRPGVGHLQQSPVEKRFSMVWFLAAAVFPLVAVPGLIYASIPGMSLANLISVLPAFVVLAPETLLAVATLMIVVIIIFRDHRREVVTGAVASVITSCGLIGLSLVVRSIPSW
jgi:hypothetical protein